MGHVTSSDLSFIIRFGSLKNQGCVNTILAKEACANGFDDDRIYYEPPVDGENSKCRNADTGKLGVPGFMREESVYENCVVEDGMTKMDDETDNLYEQVPDEFKKTRVRFDDNVVTRSVDDGVDTRNDCSVTQNQPDCACPSYSDVAEDNNNQLSDKCKDERTVPLNCMYSEDDLNGDHIYVNGTVANSVNHFYVTPKYSYEQETVVSGTAHKEESIYDVPK